MKVLRKIDTKTLNFKIICTIVIAMILSSFVIIFISKAYISKILYEKEDTELRFKLNAISELFNANYPGEWKIKDNSLYKGDTKINGEQKVTKMNIKDSIHVTVFLNDIRIATSIKDEYGKEIIGQKASNTVIENVLNNGEDYIGKIEISKKDYEAIYTPIKDANDKIIGMLFIGEPIAHVNLLSDKIASMNFLINAVVSFSILVIIIIIVFIELRQLKPITSHLISIESGDLSQSIKGNDKNQLGKILLKLESVRSALSEIISSIVNYSKSLTSSSDSLAAAAEESAASSEVSVNIGTKIAESSTKQTELVASGSESSALLTECILKVVSGIDQIMKFSIKLEESLNTSNNTVKELSTNSLQTTDSIENTYNSLADMNESMSDINKILEISKRISNQTKLLSLNASIEAARAGEAGKGFSVVASEINKLAIESKESSEHIQKIVDEVTKKSASTIVEMKTTKEIVNKLIISLNNLISIFEVLATLIVDQKSTLSYMDKETENMQKQNSTFSRIMEEISNSSKENQDAAENFLKVIEEQSKANEDVAAEAMAVRSNANDLATIISVFTV